MPSAFANELIALLPRLRRFARGLTGAQDRADDLVQAACERALRAEARFEPGSRLDAWMFRIIRNLWIDGLRAGTSSGGTHLPLDEAEEIPHGDGPSRVETMLMLRKVREVIATLPPEQREVVALVCVEEMTYREAAEMLDVPIGTVMSRLARARRRIADAVGADAALPVAR